MKIFANFLQIFCVPIIILLGESLVFEIVELWRHLQHLQDLYIRCHYDNEAVGAVQRKIHSLPSKHVLFCPTFYYSQV